MAIIWTTQREETPAIPPNIKPTMFLSEERPSLPPAGLAGSSGIVMILPRTPLLRRRRQSRQGRFAHQPPIALARGAAPFVDRPHHQALAPAHVARREHAGDAGEELAVFRLGVGPGVFFHAELIEQ